MSFAIIVAGLGGVFVLGTWVGVCVADAADSEREALVAAERFTAQLDATARLWGI